MALGGFWEAFGGFQDAFRGFWVASWRPRERLWRSLGSVMGHFWSSLVSSVGNMGPYEIYEIHGVFNGFSRVGRHPGGIWRHPGSIWNHLEGIWRQLGGIWRLLGGIWRLLGGRRAGLGDPRLRKHAQGRVTVHFLGARSKDPGCKQATRLQAVRFQATGCRLTGTARL